VDRGLFRSTGTGRDLSGPAVLGQWMTIFAVPLIVVVVIIVVLDVIVSTSSR
jgi:hypothetical protein